jgi:hypothetical protein
MECRRAGKGCLPALRFHREAAKFRGRGMQRLLGMIYCWIVLLPAYAATPSYDARLEEMLREYQQIQAALDVGNLVRLDEKIRDLIEETQREHRQSVKWDSKYAVIGVDQGDGLLLYSGKLLAEAHRLDPKSPYRERTLCSRIIDHGAWGAMPDLENINAYLKEFPGGYCSRDAQRNLATFFSDLYGILIELQDPKYEKDYKYDCFAPYINTQSYKQQAQHAKELAVAHFELALSRKRLRSTAYWSDEDLRENIQGLMNGKGPDGWFWCAD